MKKNVFLYAFPFYFVFISCASQPTISFQQQIQKRDIAGAEKRLESLYNNKKSIVLHNLYRATLQQLNGDFVKSNSILEEIKPVAEELALLSVTETAGASTISESLQSYSGSQFERLMIYCHKFLNYMTLGLFNEARIESQQAELKLREWKKDLKDFPFLPFFSAIAYEGLGDSDNALVAYRRSIEAYEGHAPAVVKQSYLNALARNNRRAELKDKEELFNMGAQYSKDTSASLVMFISAGMVSARYASTIENWESGVDFISVPAYPIAYAPVPAPTLQIEQTQLNSHIIINVEEEMRSALARAMPGYIARGISRAIIRNQAQQKAEQESTLLGVVIAIAGTITEATTTDTRSWDILPQSFFVIRTELPSGNYPVRINISGTTFTPREHMIELKPGLNFILVQAR